MNIGRAEDRTSDLLFSSPKRYQLSYAARLSWSSLRYMYLNADCLIHNLDFFLIQIKKRNPPPEKKGNMLGLTIQAKGID